MKYQLDEIKLELSYYCNLKCVHCSSEADNRQATTIPYDDVVRIVDSASRMGVKTISLSGGEPLLIPYLGDLVQYCYDNGVQTKIYTNGTVFSAGNVELFKNTNSSLAVSLYSNDASVHNRITKQDSFDQTVSTIKKLTTADVKTEVHFVPLSLNYKNLDQVVEFASSLGVAQTSVLRFVPQGRGGKTRDLLLNRSQFLELRKDILRMRERGHVIRTGSPMNFLFLNQQPKCNSGINRLVIGPNQNIYPCDAFKQITAEEYVGEDLFSNLRTHSLEECWDQSAYLAKVRGDIADVEKSSCSTCKKFNVCRGGCLAQKVLNDGSYSGQADPLCILNQGGDR